MSPLQLPPASLGGSPVSASGSDPGSFQTTPLQWDLEHVRFCTHPLRAYLSFPQPFNPPEHKPRWFSKSDILGPCLPSAGSLSWGAQCGAQTTCSLGRTSVVVIILLFVGHPTQGMGLDCTANPLLLPISLWLFLYVLSCGRSFMLDFGLSHQ